MRTLEQWKKITEYQGHAFTGKYEVSNWGNIRNATTKTPLAFYDDERGQGYLRCKITATDGTRVAIKIHRLVAFTFLEPGAPDQTEVNHKDGNPKNNSWTNLEWCTHKENIHHYHEGRKAV